MLNECIDKGWKSYLGDPIYKYRRELQKEVDRMKKEILELSKAETPKPEKPKQTKSLILFLTGGLIYIQMVAETIIPMLTQDCKTLIF